MARLAMFVGMVVVVLLVLGILSSAMMSGFE